MTEPNQNQLWRDLVWEEITYADYLRTKDSACRVMRLQDMSPQRWRYFLAIQRPVTCNCPALREALERQQSLWILAEPHLNKIDDELNRPRFMDILNPIQLCAKALAATPCTSGGKSDALEIGKARADGYALGKEQAEADREQWKERTEKAERDQTTPKCSVCDWTNVGCLNIGEAGKPKWICHGCIKRELDKPQPAWIPLHGPGSRKPTAEDADDNRLVLFRHDGGRPWIGTFSPYGGDPTHWHAIRKFTPEPDPDMAAFEECFKSGNMNHEQVQWVKAGWQAALAHRDAQAEAASRDMAQKLEKAEAACREVANFDWGNCGDSIDRIIDLCREAVPKP